MTTTLKLVRNIIRKPLDRRKMRMKTKKVKVRWEWDWDWLTS